MRIDQHLTGAIIKEEGRTQTFLGELSPTDPYTEQQTKKAHRSCEDAGIKLRPGGSTIVETLLLGERRHQGVRPDDGSAYFDRTERSRADSGSRCIHDEVSALQKNEPTIEKVYAKNQADDVPGSRSRARAVRRKGSREKGSMA
jgi:hypothetical protein